jgi:hypothetical protein
MFYFKGAVSFMGHVPNIPDLTEPKIEIILYFFFITDSWQILRRNVIVHIPDMIILLFIKT